MRLEYTDLTRDEAERLERRYLDALGGGTMQDVKVRWYPQLDELQRGDIITIAGDAYVFNALETHADAEGITATLRITPVNLSPAP